MIYLQVTWVIVSVICIHYCPPDLEENSQEGGVRERETHCGHSNECGFTFLHDKSEENETHC